MPSQHNSDKFGFAARPSFYQGLKSKVGLAEAKAAALRINLYRVYASSSDICEAWFGSGSGFGFGFTHLLAILLMHFCVVVRLVHKGRGS